MNDLRTVKWREGREERERVLEKMEKGMSRREKRKTRKKNKRKQTRKGAAEKKREEEDALLNDPDEQMRMALLEQEEAERMQRDRILFEERERAWMEMINSTKQQQSNSHEDDNRLYHSDSEEEGPPRIIWQGNEIILKKKKKKKKKNDHNNRPISNPFPPPVTEISNPFPLPTTVSPHFGTEQDKAHCPFHLKTGACRFGERCSRVHYYPDKSSTLLIKNMYNGPGLLWDHDDALEVSSSFSFFFISTPLQLFSGVIQIFDHGALLQTNAHELQRLSDCATNTLNLLMHALMYTDEEIECSFEEFYEDVHTEFLKFGEIVNFKVCKNGSSHLRGNVYVQYKLLDSALLAYNSVNGRYFAGKQVSCQFVNLTRWKVAICGEYMKSGFKTCSHGTACNFIHCFRNPGGDYEWADSDRPPPKYWVKKIVALFGYSDDDEIPREHGSLSLSMSINKSSKADSDRYYSRRSRSREMDQLSCGHSSRKREDERKQKTPDEEQNAKFKDRHKRKSRGRTSDTDSDKEWLEKEGNKDSRLDRSRNNSFNNNWDDNSKGYEGDSDVDWDTRENGKQHGRERRNFKKWNRDSRGVYEAGSDGHRDGERHHISKSKSSRHQSGNGSDSDKDLQDRGEIETQHDYSRKSLRHRRSGLQDCNKYCENENDKVDRGWSEGESAKREHHHRKKRSKH
ncbi:hypothetical protein RJT34_13279 [Clitoria ternatea]|uniref:Zinc finger CCCH domain-containing protein 5 n=1 Tax=Clitoria ternatea TaxID=43366 RepID=A0AAN9PLA4_CLITE